MPCLLGRAVFQRKPQSLRRASTSKLPKDLEIDAVCAKSVEFLPQPFGDVFNLSKSLSF
jgi:hypothetical protein